MLLFCSRCAVPENSVQELSSKLCYALYLYPSSGLSPQGAWLLLWIGTKKGSWPGLAWPLTSLCAMHELPYRYRIKMPNMKPNLHCLKISLNNCNFFWSILLLLNSFFEGVNYFSCFCCNIVVKNHTSGVLGSVISLQLQSLGSYEGGLLVSYQQPLLTRVPSETNARESARSILKCTFSARTLIWKCYLLGILGQKYSSLHYPEWLSWQFLLFYLACWNVLYFPLSWRIASLFPGHPVSIHRLSGSLLIHHTHGSESCYLYGISNVEGRL